MREGHKKNGARPQNRTNGSAALKKTRTGISGLDEVTHGGLPQGRATILCGGPGCGKTLLGLEFLVRGALEFNEPGVCMAFEESPEELTENAAALGFDLNALVARKKLFMDSVYLNVTEVRETGDYDLQGLFLRLQAGLDAVGAKRVLLDTLEALFSGFHNESILRAEIRRLFRWLKDRGVTVVITAEQGTETLTRYGLEEYVSDCVIVLDHRVDNEISTRRLRVIKYRGSKHGTNEYPFLIDQEGISVLPVTSFGLDHRVPLQRIPSGIADLDDMLEGKGFFKGSTILVSGSAGSGKTSIATHFADSICRRGEKCIFLSLEESVSQVARNVRSLGLDLDPWIKSERLLFDATRPTEFGLEMHLARLHKRIEQIKPAALIMDPITNLASSGDTKEIRSMLMRLMDFLKSRQITGLFTSLTAGGDDVEQTEVGVSSLIDTWILLRELESSGERNRVVYVVKSRGMAHSNQVREFVMTSNGIRLVPVYLGVSGVLTGSARVAQELREKEESILRENEAVRFRQELEQKRTAMEASIAALRAEFASERQRIERAVESHQRREQRITADRSAMARSRAATTNGKPALARVAGESS